MMKVLKWLRNPREYFVRWLVAQLAEYSERTDSLHKERLKGRMKTCGTGVCFNGHIRVTGCEFIEIGDNVHIGDNAFIRGEGGLTIGENTHISRNLTLYTINHNYLGACLPYDEDMITKPVRIGRNVWIGMNVCIVPGTTIGEGAIVGMGTVVFGNVPPLAIVGAPSWQQIGERDKDHYECLDENGLFGGVGGRILDLSAGGDAGKQE